MNNRVLIIGGKLDDRNYLAKVNALGLAVFAVQSKELVDETYAAYADQFIVCDYLRSETLFPMIVAAHHVAPFGAVVSLTENGLLPAAKLNEILGLRATSLRTTTLLKDKWAMRQHLRAAGLSPVRAAIGYDKADLHDFAKSCDGPFIAKPIDGSGSTFIFLVENEHDIDATAARFAAAGLNRFLMEEYLDGCEISVETFSFSGSHIIIAITHKWTTSPGFVEVGHAVPALLDEAECQAVESCVMQFLNAVGLTDGPAHTEVKLTSRGPRIIESHNRVGGDKINELVRLAYGVDMVSMTYAWAFGICEPMTASPTLRAAAAIRFLVAEPGTIKAIRGADEVRSDRRVVELDIEKKVDDVVHAVRDSDDRCGHLIVSAASCGEAIDLCILLAKRVTIETSDACIDPLVSNYSIPSCGASR